MRHAHLDWPFFADGHRELGRGLEAWCTSLPAQAAHEAAPDVDAVCRSLVRALGAAGWLRYCVPAAHGGALATLDSRALCVARETLAFHDGLADFAFAMQGLGSGAITLAGTDDQQRHWLPAVARGDAIAAFALSEPDAGSDVGAMTHARGARRHALGARRLQDLDLQWRHRRLLLRVRAHRKRDGRQGNLARSSCRPTARGSWSPSGST